MRPAKSYLVCASPRSGTTMLCRALTDTGVAGRPEEYFLAEDPAGLPDWQKHWGFWEDGLYGLTHGATDRESYLEIVYRLGTTPNGVFGAKIHWNTLRWAVAKFREMPRFAGMDRAEVFHAAFPGLHVVHVSRRDRVRQAVSWARMAQDGVWVVSDDEPADPKGEPHYSFEFVHGLHELIAEGERGWRQLYAELGVTPYEVVYEDLVTDDGWERAIRGVLDHLGVRPATLRVPERRTHRQADGLNEDWVARYLADRGEAADGAAGAEGAGGAGRA